MVFDGEQREERFGAVIAQGRIAYALALIDGHIAVRPDIFNTKDS